MSLFDVGAFEYKGAKMATITGSVSAEVATGETVTITVTSSSGAITTAMGITNSTGAFSIPYSNLPGNYTEVPSIGVDSQYASAVGTSVPFTIGLLPRTITSSVSS